MTAKARPPTLVMRALRRTPDGTEEIDEREVRCDSAEELYDLLRRTPAVHLPPPPAEELDSRWQETVGALRSWLTSLRLVLEESTGEAGQRCWTFGFQPAEKDRSTTEPTAQRIEFSEGGSLDVAGSVEAAVHAGPDGGSLVARQVGQNVQMLNTGLMTWQTNNIVCQMQMHVHLTVRPGERAAPPS